MKIQTFHFQLKLNPALERQVERLKAQYSCDMRSSGAFDLKLRGYTYAFNGLIVTTQTNSDTLLEDALKTLYGLFEGETPFEKQLLQMRGSAKRPRDLDQFLGFRGMHYAQCHWGYIVHLAHATLEYTHSGVFRLCASNMDHLQHAGRQWMQLYRDYRQTQAPVYCC